MYRVFESQYKISVAVDSIAYSRVQLGLGKARGNPDSSGEVGSCIS